MTQIKYTLTSPKFNGNLVFGLTGDVLTLVENNTDMVKHQMEWVLGVLAQGRKLNQLSQMIAGSLEMVPTDLSFDAFWKAYNKKINRKRCEPLWKKMSDAERVECLMNIPKYHAFLKRFPTRGKLDPESYLRKGAYQNDWSKIKD